jgi:hypothetical protein
MKTLSSCNQSYTHNPYDHRTLYRTTHQTLLHPTHAPYTRTLHPTHDTLHRAPSYTENIERPCSDTPRTTTHSCLYESPSPVRPHAHSLIREQGLGFRWLAHVCAHALIQRGQRQKSNKREKGRRPRGRCKGERGRLSD